MMNIATQIRLASGICLISLIGVAATLELWKPSAPPSVSQMLGAPTTVQQVRLFKSGKDAPPEYVAQDYYTKPGHDRLIQSHIINKSGTTEDDQYRQGLDEVARIKQYSQEYYALLPNEAHPRLYAAAMFAADGITYQKHVVRRRNGSIERIGQRLRDGRYETRYMFDDPDHLDRSTVWRLRYFDGGLNFVSETIYSWNKDHTDTYVAAKIIRGDFAGQFYVSTYREDGSLSATMKHSPGSDTGTVFAPDGFVLADWGNDMSSASYFTVYQKGSDLPVQVWESAMGRMRVTVIDAQTHGIVYQQMWKERPDPANPQGKIYLLMRVGTEFQGSHPQVQVEMAGNGSHPAQVTIDDAQGDHTVKKLDQAGKKVILVEKLDRQGTPLLASAHPDDGDEVRIDPAILKIPARPEVPTFSDFGPPRIYDYP